jgi:hypothetical protein
MSHVTVHGQKITDISRLCNIASKKGYDVYEESQFVKLYGRTAIKALASIKITDWRFPLAITPEGEIKYDHFGSKPGTMELFGEMLQEYNESLTFDHIPFDEINSYSIESNEKGDRILTLEYGT